MTQRTWVYAQLTTFPGLIALIGDTSPRVFAKKSMTSAIEAHPFIVYKLGNRTNNNLAEDTDSHTQFIEVWCHDYSDGETADYMQIDAVLEQVRLAFRLQSSPEDGIIAVQYIETSQDLNDETLNTVMKYSRFQLITKEE